ncbi:MAG TPA: DUF3570 domain-containing protein [Gammaproteobacteria bacterium]|nr:DUF3570 domain-containing protein [Gammaproteobacteria bacterium]
MAVTSRIAALACSGFCLLGMCSPLLAGVLPDDRADVLYHSYDGGGVQINGPSLLVLKKIGQDVAVTGNYYVDSVSSASIDVVTSGASKYSEKRTEVSAGIEYLHGDSSMSLSYTNSDENDYQANTAGFGISMDMFGNMTTVSMGYLRSWDTVENNTDPTFSKDVDRQNYQLGLTQVLTPDLLMEVNFETITDEGYLNNPYRSVRYLDPSSQDGYSFEPEVYPHTRTSNALAVRSSYYLPYRAAVQGEYRFFDDSWGIRAHNFRLGYAHPLESGWILECNYRYYTQTSADFYSDLFPSMNAQNFMSRDKELSNFTSHSAGFTLTYDLLANGWRFIDRGSISLAYEHIWYGYEDFRDLRDVEPVPGTEPLYSFSASVAQLYLSIWF